MPPLKLISLNIELHLHIPEVARLLSLVGWGKQQELLSQYSITSYMMIIPDSIVHAISIYVIAITPPDAMDLI